ncbi:MAG: YbaB/EbfC family nucleoid-associated protein [Micromonosporaceae bacterium]|nr:YbaB/EbfC family nucleoid-associated protein [Micromonosporaceae bacterium]
MEREAEQVAAAIEASRARIQQIQQAVERMVVTGYSRNRELSVRVLGTGTLLDVSFDDDEVLRRPRPEVLSALIVEAVNDGLHRLTVASQERFAPFIEQAQAQAEASMKQLSARY